MKMTEALWVWGLVTTIVVILLVVFIPTFSHTGMGNSCGGTRKSRGLQGSIMDRIARWVVLSLGRVTFAALHLFEKLGVNMANVDEVLAAWTAWSENIKTQLADALADAQNLRDTDAAEDAAQANALSESLALKVEAAFNAVSQPPVVEPEPEPEPPVEEPPVEEPAQ